MDRGEIMILGIEDYAVIVTLLSPVYYLSFQNSVRLSVLETRLKKILKIETEIENI